MGLLEQHHALLDPALRQTLVKALILLRNETQLTNGYNISQRKWPLLRTCGKSNMLCCSRLLAMSFLGSLFTIFKFGCPRTQVANVAVRMHLSHPSCVVSTFWRLSFRLCSLFSQWTCCTT